MESRGKKAKIVWRKNLIAVAQPQTPRQARRGKAGGKPAARPY